MCFCFRCKTNQQGLSAKRQRPVSCGDPSRLCFPPLRRGGSHLCRSKSGDRRASSLSLLKRRSLTCAHARQPLDSWTAMAQFRHGWRVKPPPNHREKLGRGMPDTCKTHWFQQDLVVLIICWTSWWCSKVILLLFEMHPKRCLTSFHT